MGELIFILVSIYLIGWLLFWSFKKIKELSIFLSEKHKEKKDVCPHGISKGDSANKCLTCAKEKEKLLINQQIKENSKQLHQDETKKLLKQMRKNNKYLQSLSPQEFENVVSDMLRELGYNVNQTPYINDGGKDAVAWKDQKKYLFEYKRHSRNNSIGRPMLQKFYAAMIEEGTDIGFFITTSRFTSAAIDYSAKYNITLIDGDRLRELFEEAYPSSKNQRYQVMCEQCGDIVFFTNLANTEHTRCKNNHVVYCNINLPSLLNTQVQHVRQCPLCGHKLKRRSGRYGSFYGCMGYPHCRYTERM
ncbi:restriction endonuclease [Salibacterium halotolerans]|uniref:Topoisomerase DNA binding C4 zinc finger n=1 Tax=Salibacterium halotolerans TaxID=1884432 RepID=A0A1I5PTD8_9BACI|nr:restriction endonuclease [Salibacterium halotolerans]SFP37219.1 Topoisomerase DNA binding C4 zinc finger [Salibacterium halotolerans]